MNVSIFGAAGYVAAKHMAAIHQLGHKIVAAVDPHDSVGVLDQYGMDIVYCDSVAAWRQAPLASHCDVVAICTPSHLHVEQAAAALDAGCDVLCEKPLALAAADLDALRNVAALADRRVGTVLQLRLRPELLALKQQLEAAPGTHEVSVTFVTPRGPWYHASWKGDPARSGGLVTNIGVHIADLLIWLFGDVLDLVVVAADTERVRCRLRLERADVDLWLSISPADPRGRWMVVDGKPFDVSTNWPGAHAAVYEQFLRGAGPGIEDARPSIALCETIREIIG